MVENPENLITDKKIKLLDGLSVDEKMEFSSFGTVREYYLHDKIITENQEDMNIYLIMDGEVSVWRKNIPIFELKKGDVFNETKIFSPKPNSITVVAEKQTTIMKIGRKEVLNYFSLKPERLFKIFVLNIVSILSKKLENYEEKLVSHYYQAISLLKGE